MGRSVDRKIPLFWFAVLLIVWIASYAATYIHKNEELSRIDAFMQAGGRFTREDGDKLAARIQALEDKNYIEVYTIPEKLSEKIPNEQ